MYKDSDMLLAATTAFLQSPEGRCYCKVGPPIKPSGSGTGGTGIAVRKGGDALLSFSAPFY